ncbi:MAG: YifB family Mg chelatase-like AAA ATPase [Chloroflexota bacterium]
MPRNNTLRGDYRQFEAVKMLGKVTSCALVGLEGELIQVEVDISRGLPSMIIVGLPDAAVQESRERVRAAIKNTGLPFPAERLTVNLAPADIRKEGPAYDLPIAIGILLAAEQIYANLDQAIVMGELSLDGSVRHVSGVLPMANLARQAGFTSLFVPAADAAEAALIEGVTIYPIESLLQLVDHLSGHRQLCPYQVDFSLEGDPPPYACDLAEIKGQEHVKRALEVAAAGGHNMLMTGPPGAGKTLIARSMPGILPQLSVDEALDVTRIYSVADQLPPDEPLIRHRPFRSPHHTVSYAGLIGGGRWPKPGEISLAHRGVLFLDELPEFGTRMLEMLRQPLEDRVVSISRSAGALTYPANFTLIASMNPCPCGHYGDPVKECTCSMSMVKSYQKKISGPLLDRIDIHVEVPRVPFDKLSSQRTGEPSAVVRARVEAARARQRERFKGTTLQTNSDMGPAEIRRFCLLDAAGTNLVKAAMQQMQLSARAYHRILKLARTIADLAGVEQIQTPYVAEAIQYRPRLRV